MKSHSWPDVCMWSSSWLLKCNLASFVNQRRVKLPTRRNEVKMHAGPPQLQSLNKIVSKLDKHVSVSMCECSVLWKNRNKYFKWQHLIVDPNLQVKLMFLMAFIKTHYAFSCRVSESATWMLFIFQLLCFHSMQIFSTLTYEQIINPCTSDLNEP